MDPTILQKQIRDNNADLLDFCKDMDSWREETKRRESKQSKEVDSEISLPRNVAKRKSVSKSERKKSTEADVETAIKKSKAPKDFSFWEKFDADAECEMLDDDDADDGKLTDESEDTEEAIEEANEFKAQGNDFVKQGKWMQAKESYTSAINRYNLDPTYYCNLALCLLNLNDFKRAETNCSIALQLDKKYVKALFRRAKARVSLQQNEDAAEDLRNLLVIEPENKEAQKMLDSLTTVQKTENKPKEVAYVSKFNASRGKTKSSVILNTTSSSEPAFTGKIIENKVIKEPARIKTVSKSQNVDTKDNDIDLPWPSGNNVILEKSITKLPKDRSHTPLKRIPVIDRCFKTT